jgi:hypothetical protein
MRIYGSEAELALQRPSEDPINRHQTNKHYPCMRCAMCSTARFIVLGTCRSWSNVVFGQYPGGAALSGPAEVTANRLGCEYICASNFTCKAYSFDDETKQCFRYGHMAALAHARQNDDVSKQARYPDVFS